VGETSRNMNADEHENVVDESFAVADESNAATGEVPVTESLPEERAAQTQQPEMSELDQCHARITSLEDSLLRAKADYQNLQRRVTIERIELLRYANADLMRALLGVLDDFDRALEAAKASENIEAVVDGVRLVHQNLVKSLTDAGLEPIEALHQPFDPAIHEALLQQPTDEHQPGTVIEQAARGFKLRDRVLRPAKVVVAKAID